jgi:hypothetical protein
MARRILWFIALWVAGVATLALVGGILKYAVKTLL